MQKTDKYPKIQIQLHWLTFILVMCTYLWVWLAKYVLTPFPGVDHFFWLMHFFFGALVFVFTCIRFVVQKLLQRYIPEVVPAIPKWQYWTATVVKILLVVVYWLIPLAGYLYRCQKGATLDLYVKVFQARCEVDLSSAQMWHAIHVNTAYLALALIAVHSGFVLFNHYVRKNNMLLRMMPKKRGS
ncbi:cytochrome b [Psittacicella gerlachiana]|nr:cytochrome b/b6 domain-containing protein [Psittacicella gerlachiana]